MARNIKVSLILSQTQNLCCKLKYIAIGMVAKEIGGPEEKDKSYFFRIRSRNNNWGLSKFAVLADDMTIFK